jgi:DNA mismatch repair protein MutS
MENASERVHLHTEKAVMGAVMTNHDKNNMTNIDKSKLTPMMRQYFEIKEQYMDYILMYRLGDFYEMFFDDAVRASKALEITLTSRACGLEEKAPLCGVPYHAVDVYIKKFVDQGIKIAICEQMEDPALAKGIVKREVTRIITPGTVTDPEMLDASNNNYVAALYPDESGAGVAYCDITTGHFKTTVIRREADLIDELLKIEPSELLIPNRYAVPKSFQNVLDASGIVLTPYLDYAFQPESADQTITRVLNVFSTESLGFSDYPEAAVASGALLAYIEETAKVPLAHIARIEIYGASEFMVLDKFTRRNLELVETMRSKEKRGSLLWVLDKTCTAMGARKLKAWIEEPLLDAGSVKKRLDAVGALKDDLMLRSDLRTHLKEVYDLERLTSKLVYGSINPRDLVALKRSLTQLPDLKLLLESVDAEALAGIREEMDALEDVCAKIESAIEDEPPFLLKDGGVIRTGYHDGLDELRDAVQNGKNWILELEQSEREKWGIKTLKVGYNKVFGYYIEISRGNAKMAPETYIRKQTLANAERFITPKLKDLEEKVLGSEEKIVRLEAELFAELKADLMLEVARLQKTASAVAALDVLVSFAECSYRYGYVKPKVSEGSAIRIQDGRHPVIERIFNDTAFVPNDTFLDRQDHKFYIITGPNMAGKSTYLRQVALIVLMAQIGCFVPAKKAEIGIVDRIFTRVGASDDLSQGQSTFMVEMNELANILNNATKRSLIILDEIGRGTSTYDGLSIAWSVVEYIASLSGLNAKTLFATHYHELTELEGRIEGVRNYRIAVKEVLDDIVFLRKIEPGGANQSYGIQVAKLAGVPDTVIRRAKEILARLEINDINNNLQTLSSAEHTETNQTSGSDDVRGTFTNVTVQDSEIKRFVEQLNLNEMTPIEAMNALNQIMTYFKEEK